MSVHSAAPRFMEHLLEELGWNQGTMMPLANAENREIENSLISRQNEVQRLKEALAAQKQKRKDLEKYKQTVNTEYQENTRLLLAHKQQLEQEVKLRQLSCNEADALERDVSDFQKKSKDIGGRVDRLQNDIAKLLKKADTLKTDVCGERGALQEWRAALDRGANDIAAIEQFTKQDISRAKEMEYKRQKLKVEHDRMQQQLNALVSDLAAEERACEKISVQVMEGMDQRKQMVQMWSNAVENLRQRDTDIRHFREDYAVLEAEANNLAEQCREQQAFCDQQKANNAEATRENMHLAHVLSQIRMSITNMLDNNQTLESEEKCLQRESANMQARLEKLHMENKQIMDAQQRRDKALKNVSNKLIQLKESLAESLDKTKNAERRAKQLEEILNEEERYASQLTVNQQRAMHCSFVEQQKLLALKNEEKLFRMQLRAATAMMSKLEYKQQSIEKVMQSQKEALYAICYQVETLGSRAMMMEGNQAERECSAELVEKENRLKDVCARHAARVTLLEKHSARLHDDMRKLARDIELRTLDHTKLKSRLKTSLLEVEGSEKDVKSFRETWRRERVDEALMRLKVAHATRAVEGLDDTAFTLDKQRLQLDAVAHATRAVEGLDDTAFTLDKQRLQLDAAMNERLVEIAARRDMFSVQKRALVEDCGRLSSEIKEREQRIEQLKKRYDIFINSLGKDESGNQLSVSFFKIKFAAERAELRERGASLDADITRRERDVAALEATLRVVHAAHAHFVRHISPLADDSLQLTSRDVAALEATLRVVHAAHAHFVRHISPLADDTPEMEELRSLMEQYYAIRDELKIVRSKVTSVEQAVEELAGRLTMLTDKKKQLTAREAEAESELEIAHERAARQQARLSNAHEVVRGNVKRAKKLIEGVDEWRIFQLAIWIRDYAESAHNAVHALSDMFSHTPAQYQHFAALVASTDLRRHLTRHQRALLGFVQRIVSVVSAPKEATIEIDESVFSPSSESARSGISVATGYTRRLAGFRKTLATKVQENVLIEDIPEVVRRSTVSLRVVTLGIEESLQKVTPSMLDLSKLNRRVSRPKKYD